MRELAGHSAIENAMAFAQQPVFTVSPRLKLGLAWQNVSSGNLLMLDKNGGLNNTSTYNGFADCIDHQFRMFLMYFVAAIRVGNMLFVGHKLGEPFLCFLLCGIGDIAEVRRDIGW